MIKELWKKEFETYEEYVEEIKDFMEEDEEEEIDGKKQRMYGFEWKRTSGYYKYVPSNTEVKEWLEKNNWQYVKTI